MASPSHTIAASLRQRPALALAVLFAVVLSILAAATVVTGAGMDPARAVFYSAGPVLFTSVGAVTSVPLALLGDAYGVWSASLGAHVYTFNDNLETINEDNDPWVVGMAGLSVAY